MSDILSVQKFTSVIDDGFSSTTTNNRAADIEQEASEIPFYLFDITNTAEETSGYALTCGDTRLPAILAVVEDGEFDWDHPFTDIFYSNLGGYILETIELYNNMTDEDVSAAQEKIEYLEQRGTTTTANGITTYISHPTPLTVKTSWNQSSPYWDVINSIRGKSLYASYSEKVYTGCVATAVAQIMAYHKWPAWPAKTINGKTSFLNPYTNTTKIFWDLYYHWDSMTAKPNAYALGNDAKMEIGVLMHEIGTNVKMSYSTTGSGAYSSDVVTGITKMGYKQPSLVAYNLATIKSSIDAYKPVYITGHAKKNTSTSYAAIDIFHWFPKTSTSYTEGHAWVIDNYKVETAGPLKREFVYCNLGWGGTATGWYISGIFDTTLPVSRGTSGKSRYYQYKLEIIPNITPNK